MAAPDGRALGPIHSGSTREANTVDLHQLAEARSLAIHAQIARQLERLEATPLDAERRALVAARIARDFGVSYREPTPAGKGRNGNANRILPCHARYRRRRRVRYAMTDTTSDGITPPIGCAR